LRVLLEEAQKELIDVKAGDFVPEILGFELNFMVLAKTLLLIFNSLLIRSASLLKHLGLLSNFKKI